MNVQVFDSPDKVFLLADFGGQAKGLKFGTNEHGFAECGFFVPMSQELAFAVYDWPVLPHLVLSDNEIGVAYEGRLEDITIVDGGVQFGALGYWRALSDVPYTALWSSTGVEGWYQVVDHLNCKNGKYAMDSTDRLFISPRKNEIFPNGAHIGAWTYETPDGGGRQIIRVLFDYDYTLPTNWRGRLNVYDRAYGSGSVAWEVIGDGANHTGSASITTASRDRAVFTAFNFTGGNYTVTAETEAWYLKITNIRIKTTSASTVLASAIAAALATYVNGINGDQMSADSTKIEGTATDLMDELYEDIYPADIMDRLALLHNYETGIWEGRRLHFRPKGSAGRRWNVNVTRILELQRSLENVRNSAYAIYKEPGGRVVRTAVADDAASQGKWSIVRRGFVNVTTTDQTEAETHRDAFLSDRKDFAVRANIEFDRLIDPISQASYPVQALRAGDTVTMQNLPVGLSVEIDNIRTFLVGRTEAVEDDDGRWKINLEPETPTPTLVTLIARKDL